MDANEDRALIIRYHPNEMHLFPQGLSHPRVFLSTLQQQVQEAILASDLVVVQLSTVGLEAAIAGKPVVALVNSPLCLSLNFDYQALGVAYAAPDVLRLHEVIDQALIEGCFAPELSRNAQAAPLIVNEIINLIDR